MEDLVSIITPSYNSVNFIEETINSVITQTHQNWEMIIVDDCSKDNSVELIQEYVNKDSRIKLIQNKENKGAAETRNIALRIAKGKFIAFLDSDDLWLPQKLEKQLNFMKKNEIAFSFTSYQIIDEKGASIGKIVRAPNKISYSQYLKNTIIGCLTVIIDRSKVGVFEMPNIRSSQDMALWLLIMKRGFSAYGYDKVLSKYRLVTGSITSNKHKSAKSVWRVYREIEKLSFYTSVISFIGYAYNGLKKRF